MEGKHFPAFKKSDLYYKLLTTDDSNAKGQAAIPPRTLRLRSVVSIPESSSRSSSSSRQMSRVNSSAGALDLGRNGMSSSDLISPVKGPDSPVISYGRRSLDIGASSPLFDDDLETENMSRSTQSIDVDSMNGGDQPEGNQDRIVEAMEAALTTIMTDGPHDEEVRQPLFDDFESDSLFTRNIDSNRPSSEFKQYEVSVLDKGRERPNLASLGLVNTSSRIGVFTDDDLFGDEEKFLEDEHADPEEFTDEKVLEDEIHEAAPGDLGLAEAISALTADIERFVAQESIVDTLTRKAELTNNLAELRILGKSKSSLRREIRRKELQRQQYIVQESDNSLYGRATISIKSIMVGKEPDGQEFALYVIEVERAAGDGENSAASWAVARRYSEFHDLHQRLRAIYPAVRSLDFPRRRLVMKLQREFLHKRRVSLENYLQELLRLPAVCRSRDLRAFLSQQAIISTHPLGPDSDRRDIVSRIYNSVTDGMDDFLGNIPVLDQLSVAGQNLISAATSQYNTHPGGAVPSENAIHDSIVGAQEAQAELAAFDAKDAPLPPFVKAVSDIFLETFELNRSQNWLRGRAVVVVLHQLLGGTVERKIRETAKALVSDANLLKYISLLKDTMWPTGVLLRDRKPRTEAQKKATQREASVMLATLLPDLAGNVVGRGNAQAAGRRVFATLNNERLNAHLAYTLLDRLVDVLFPEIGMRTTA